jgi:hypothetical protein
MIIDYDPSLNPEERAKQIYNKFEGIWDPDVKKCLLKILVRDALSRIHSDRRWNLEVSSFEDD